MRRRTLAVLVLVSARGLVPARQEALRAGIVLWWYGSTRTVDAG